MVMADMGERLEVNDSMAAGMLVPSRSSRPSAACKH